MCPSFAEALGLTCVPYHADFRNLSRCIDSARRALSLRSAHGGASGGGGGSGVSDGGGGSGELGGADGAGGQGAHPKQR